MAAVSVRPLRRSDRKISRPVSGGLRGAVQASPADRLRDRLSLAVERIQPAVVDQGALTALTSERSGWGRSTRWYWLLRSAAEKSPGRQYQNQQRNGRQQIDVSGIVTPVADFPAH